MTLDQSAFDIPLVPMLPPGVEPLEVTRALAAGAHPQIVSELAFRANDPRITTSQLLALSEHFGKLSGLYAKQEETAQKDRFVFNIHLGGAPSDQSIVIDCQPSDELGELPAFMQPLVGLGGNLDEQLALLEADCG